MDDLISRAYVLAEYDRQHKGPPGGARKIIEDAPAVDAIPVEWLMQQITGGSDMTDLLHDIGIKELIIMWQAEQEASE